MIMNRSFMQIICTHQTVNIFIRASIVPKRRKSVHVKKAMEDLLLFEKWLNNMRLGCLARVCARSRITNVNVRFATEHCEHWEQRSAS